MTFLWPKVGMDFLVLPTRPTPPLARGVGGGSVVVVVIVVVVAAAVVVDAAAVVFGVSRGMKYNVAGGAVLAVTLFLQYLSYFLFCL